MFNIKNINKNKIGLIGINNIKYTYGDILKKSEEINSFIEKKSLILIVCRNSIESIIGYISFLENNHITIILDHSFKEDYVNKIIKLYKPQYIYSDAFFFKIQNKYKKLYSFKNFNLYKSSYKKNFNINKKNYILLSTSGTTQNPKFVRISKNNIKNNTMNIIDYLKIRKNHTAITTMPMGYSYGLSIINTHLYAEAQILVNELTIFDKNFWKNVNKFKVTSIGGVPQFYEYLMKLRLNNLPISKIKYFTQAGGKLSKNITNYFSDICKKNKIKFYIMYGQTEASPRMSYLEPNKINIKKGSIGKPLENTSFHISGENNKIIKKAFVKGELIFKGKNVSLGYANNFKDLKKGDINKGKLFTGDIAYKDKDNYYFIIGRKKRFSKIFGIRINLDDIEIKLKENNYIVKCLPSSENLNLIVKENYDVNKIKNILQDYSGINKNYILINKVKSFNNRQTLKNYLI